jgi:DNA-binding NarL/FixJ family response regulator
MGDGLAACFAGRTEIHVRSVVDNMADLHAALGMVPVDLVLIDVTHGIDLYDARSIVSERPDIALVALGLNEQRQEVIRCGRAGFAGYVARDASVETLCRALSDVMQGRLACSAEISGGLLRALFRNDGSPAENPPIDHALTRRESDVLALIGHGHSNKEIARELNLSVATVKHHVHNVLDKLNLPRRTQAMRRVRDAPWLVAHSEADRSRAVNRK